MSLARCRISQIVSGSSPVGFQRCTAKISEFRRGWSSKMRSVGVLEIDYFLARGENDWSLKGEAVGT